MSRRPARLLAWFLWLATIGFCAAGLVVWLAVARPLTTSMLVQGIVGILVFRLGFAVVGLVLMLRRPSNPIGWLYAAAGLVWSLEVPGTPWVEHLVRERLPLPPAAQVAAVVQEVAWAPAVALGVTLPLLLLPDGRLRSPRWRPAVIASLSGAVLVVVGVGLAPIQMASVPATNPLALAGVAGRVATVVGFTGLALHLGSLAAALVCVVLRFRSSRGVERQQLRWVATGATAAVVGLLAVSALLVAGGLWGFSSGAWVVVLLLTLPCLPVSIAMAVLRYRLYDLDYVVSRALVYGLLTAGGVAVYVAVVKSTEWLLREGVGLGGSLLATAVIAVGFAPARDRLQRFVDRRLYGDRHDPVRAMARLGERLRDAPSGVPDGDAVAGVLQVVCETLRLPSASLFVEDGVKVASFGRPATASESIPLEHEGQHIGVLVVGVRAGEDALGVADRQVLEVLAAPVAVALHAVLLSQELQRSRERLVAAREEERRRLRRDLHDGLGPILTAVTLKADAARSALDTAPDRTDALLAELRGDANQAIGDLRRVIYDLRPAALDELGLLGAISQQVDRFARQGLLISLQAPPALPVLPAAVEVATYRIVTEAITNVARHAHAHQITITIAVDGELCLAVHDDGTTPTANGGGWRPGTGLQSMNERVAELGGTLEVGPTATGGRVQASLPLELA